MSSRATKHPASTAGPGSRTDNRGSAVDMVLVWSIIAGTLLRLGIAAISFGANDAVLWQQFGASVAEVGLLESYRTQPLLNHPPLMVIWSRVALATGPGQRFSFLMKLPAIAADAAACLLLARIWVKRGDPRRARLAALAMALNPVAVLVSAYHCNTDNVYAYFSLLAMYLITERSRFFLAGLSLAAAVNVKLIPILLILPACSLCRRWRDVFHLAGGLVPGVLGLAPLLAVFDAVRHNILSYVPHAQRWGISFFLYGASLNPSFEDTALAIMPHYSWVGRWSIVLGVLALSAASLLLKRWNAYEIGTLTYAVFLVLTPGFGVQYIVILVPLLLAVSIARSWLYGTLSGLLLLFLYWVNLYSYDLPLFSVIPREPAMPGPLFGLLAWGLLVELMVKLVLRRGPSS